MKAYMCIEDRETGWIILDTATVPSTAGGCIVDFDTIGVTLADVTGDGYAEHYWSYNDEQEGPPVVRVQEIPAEGSEMVEMPYRIPECSIYLNWKEHEVEEQNNR